jgi:hypothetical protein
MRMHGGAATESNLPTRGLHGPAGFEVRGFVGVSAAHGAQLTLSQFAELTSELPSSGHISGHERVAPPIQLGRNREGLE